MVETGDERRARIYATCAALQGLGVPPVVVAPVLAFADSLCEHDWSEWSYTTSQAGARYCVKCGRRQYG